MQMILAPQLRQSLEMLQLPILELRTMLREELEQNPTLEEAPTEAVQVEIEPGNGEVESNSELDFDKEFEALAKLDEEWRDYYFQDKNARPYTSRDAEKRQFLLDSLPQTESLQEHMLHQLNLAGLEPIDKQIGELIIGSIDDDGYLAGTIEELSESSGFDTHRLEDALSIVQEFHPTGVGARDLSECLLLQLERLGKEDSLEATIVRNHIKQLAGKRFQDIAHVLHVPPEEVQQAARFIGALDPKPGRACSPEMPNYILPEVHIRKVDGEYIVILNDAELPHLRISNHYRKLLKDNSTPIKVKRYIKERIKASAFLIKSIDQRQKTIYKIASEIVKTQHDFLENGIACLKPMTMSEVAKSVGVHETTVSRAVSGKYMQTPKAIFELKYFFTPGLKTSDGGSISNKTVKEMIAGLVANEDSSHPLSDQDIMAKLKEKGINIARRTIAKYRLVLRILPSHMRKSF